VVRINYCIAYPALHRTFKAINLSYQRQEKFVSCQIISGHIKNMYGHKHVYATQITDSKCINILRILHQFIIAANNSIHKTFVYNIGRTILLILTKLAWYLSRIMSNFVPWYVTFYIQCTAIQKYKYNIVHDSVVSLYWYKSCCITRDVGD